MEDGRKAHLPQKDGKKPAREIAVPEATPRIIWKLIRKKGKFGFESTPGEQREKRSSCVNNSLVRKNGFANRKIFFLALCFFLSLPANQLARADAAPPPDPTVGGAGPYQPQKTNVQMVSETVVIEVPAYEDNSSNQISVTADFNLQNQGPVKEEMHVIFPLSRLDPWRPEESDYRVDSTTFEVWVDGVKAPTWEIFTPAEEGYELEYGSNAVPTRGFYPDVRWAAFDVAFPVRQMVSLRVGYKMLGSSGFSGVGYILETGAGWYGKILSADLILRLPYAATTETVLNANHGYVFSGNEVRWKLINFEPTREDNLNVRIVPPEEWQPILELRSQVKQHPDDVDALYALGHQYEQSGFWNSPGGILVGNWHLVDLAKESFEKAIELRPDWGDAHFRLARVLWFADPDLPRGPGMTVYKPPVLEDPVVQRVIAEMRLAGEYGVTAESEQFLYESMLRYGDFIAYLNSFFPVLGLATLTPTNTIPTIPISTSDPRAATARFATRLTPASTSTPRRMPTALPAGAPVPGGSFFLPIILVIIAGALVFLIWQSKSDFRK